MAIQGLLVHRDEVVRALGVLESAACERLVELLEGCRAQGRTVAVAGNGGSAATASHLTTDWARQGGMRMLDLCACMPLLTALGNDEGFDAVFADQVDRALRPSDLLVLLSTSGRSPNLLRAAEAARRRSVTVVALTGRRDSPLGALADVELCVGVDSPAVAEDAHLAVAHAVARALHRSLTAGRPPAATNGHRRGDDGTRVEVTARRS